MDDYYEDCEDYYLNPESLTSLPPQDELVEPHGTEEEMYEMAFDALFEKLSNAQNAVDIDACNTNEKTPRLNGAPVSLERKRKRSNKNEKSIGLSNKKRKSDCGTPVVCRNQISDENLSAKKKKTKQPLNKKSLKEIVEDAGLTMIDIKSFVDEERTYEEDAERPDSNESSYIVLSETSEQSYSESGEDDVSINVMGGRSVSNDETRLAGILDSIPDNSSWEVSITDIIGRSGNSVPRFHNSMKRSRCLNCRDTGHRSFACPRPKKEAKCILCGDTGHQYKGCPEQLCFKCSQPGHSAKECQKRMASLRDHCHRCYGRGHFVEQCPDNWRQYHLTVSDGSIVRGDESKEKSTFMSCYNCGGEDHYGNKCKELRMDKFQSVNSVFVCRYDGDPRPRDRNHEERRQEKSCRRDHQHNREGWDRSHRHDRSRHRNEDVDGFEIRTIDLTEDSPNPKPFRREDRFCRGGLNQTDVAGDSRVRGRGAAVPDRRQKKTAIKSLMDLCEFDRTDRTPRSGKRKKTKVADPEYFPREDGSRHDTPAGVLRGKKFVGVSPITPYNSSLRFNHDAEIFDVDGDQACMDDESYYRDLQESSCSSKKTKSAKRKLRKEKMKMKRQQEELKGQGHRKNKQWWATSTPKHQQFEGNGEVGSTWQEKIPNKNKKEGFKTPNDARQSGGGFVFKSI